MTPINRPDRAVGFGLFGQFLRQLRLYPREMRDAHLNLFRFRRVPSRAELVSRIEVSHALDIIRHRTSSIPRQGWVQLGLPAETESVAEHIQDCVHSFLEVAAEVGLTQEEAFRGRIMLEIHELDEVITGRDEPIIRSGEMPRSISGRRRYQQTDWEPLSRSEELKRLRDKYAKFRPKFEIWVTEHVPPEERKTWLELLREFHFVDSPVAWVCFEVHALQPSRKAVFLALEEDVDFTIEVAEAFLRRSDKHITHPHVRARLEVLRTTLVENNTDSVAVS